MLSHQKALNHHPPQPELDQRAAKNLTPIIYQWYMKISCARKSHKIQDESPSPNNLNFQTQSIKTEELKQKFDNMTNRYPNKNSE